MHIVNNESAQHKKEIDTGMAEIEQPAERDRPNILRQSDAAPGMVEHH